ncbi:hypothetical protein V6N11_068825 [Hibiscus sabdariffa]|uniref:RNase H type-1 domain-containing protein n=1 Tax=Hibiscus sabdariffa TaxID=183260 RepID=A0ABR2PAY8_9ROSI
MIDSLLLLMAACDFVGENGSNKNEENPVRSTAMRKRMASEIFDYHRDLIHTPANVSIPQHIHNVREIIYPCNPNLAALLEYKLCSLMDPLEWRRKEALPLHLPEVTLPRHHCQQQQGSSGLTLNLDSAIDSLSNYSFSDSGALNQYYDFRSRLFVGAVTPPLDGESKWGWCWDRFQDLLPPAVLLVIAAVKPPSISVSDTVGWGGNTRRHFSARSAYHLRAGIAQRGMDKEWSILSKYRGLPRVRGFIWLVLKGRILTNSERVRWHMCDDACYGLCGAAEEDLSHLFWGCVEARLFNQQQFSIRLEEWNIVFGTILWNNWTYRNRRLFAPEAICSESILHRSMRMVEEFNRACSMLRKGYLQAPLHGHVTAQWEPPPEGWIKVNSNGSRNTSMGMSTCGGVGRDSNSRYCFGFAKDIGVCSCLEAKLWGIYEGLAIAWSLSCPRIIIETDSREVYDTILSFNSRENGSSVLSSIFEMMSRQWKLRFSFLRREDNGVADAMARLILPGSLDYHHWLEPPLAVCNKLLANEGLTTPPGATDANCVRYPLHRAYDDPGDA